MFWFWQNTPVRPHVWSPKMTQIWSLDQIWFQSHQTTFQAEHRAQWWLSKYPSRAYLWIWVGAYLNPNKVCVYILWYYEQFLFSLDHVLCLSKFYYLSSPVPAWPFRLTLDLTGNFDLFFFSRKIAKLIKTVAQKSFCKFDLSEFKERMKLHLRKTSVTKMFLLEKPTNVNKHQLQNTIPPIKEILNDSWIWPKKYLFLWPIKEIFHKGLVCDIVWVWGYPGVRPHRLDCGHFVSLCHQSTSADQENLCLLGNIGQSSSSSSS